MAVLVNVVGSWNGAQLQRAEAELARLRKATEAASVGMGTSMQNAGRRMTATGATISSVGSRLTRNVSLPLAALGGFAVKTAADFEQSMNVFGAAADVSGAQLERMSDLAKKMGAETVFSANEAADAMTELAKAGITPAQIEAGALKSTMALAATEGMGLADAATVVSNAMSVFKLHGEESAIAVNALAGASKASTASVASIAQGLAQVGGPAAMAGLSIQETTAALAAFDQMGYKGSDAGTSLKTMLARLVPSTKEAADKMKDLGLKFTDAKGQFLPLTTIAQKMRTAFKDLSDEQRTQAMNTIFGSDATRAAGVFLDQGKAGIERYIKATSDQTAAQKMADARMKGAKGTLEAMKGSVETAALALGDALLPTVEKVAGWITKAANAFSGLDKHTQTTIATVGMLVIALGPVTKGFGMVVGGVGRTVTAFGTLGKGIYKASGPLRAFTQGLAAPQSGLSAFASRSQRAGSAVMRAMQATGRGVLSAMQSMGRAALSAGTAIGRAMMAAAAAVGRAMLAIGRAMLANPWMIAVAALVVAVVLIVKHWDTVKRVTLQVWNAIAAFMRQVWDKIKAPILAAVGAIRAVITAYFNAYKAIISGVFNAVLAVVRTVWNGIKVVIAGVVAAVKGYIAAWTTIITTVTGIFGRVKDAVAGALAYVVTTVKELPGKIISGLGNLGTLLFDAGKQVIQGFIDGIKNMFGSVQNTLTGLTDKLTDWKGPPKRDRTLLTQSGQLLIEGLVRGLVAGQDKVKKTLERLTVYIDRATAGAAERIGDRLEARIRSERAGLLHLAATREKMADKLKTARDKLADAIGARNDYANRIRDTFAGLADVTRVASQSGTGATSVTAILAELNKQAEAAKTFKANLEQLRKLGFSKDVIRQVAEAGVEGGGSTAAALAQATAEQVAQVNAAQTAILRTGSQVGNAVADQMYGAGVRAAQGLVEGLKKQQGAIERQMVAIAKAMQAAIKKALGIKSPSRVMDRQVGQMIPLGIVRGIDRARPALERSMATLVTTPPVGTMPVGAAAVRAAGARGGRPVIIADGAVRLDLTVQGNADGRVVSEVHDVVEAAFRDLVVQLRAG